MTETTAPEYTIKVQSLGRGRKTVVAMFEGDRSLVMEKVDIADAAIRTAFVDRLCTQYSGLNPQRDAILAQLQEQAAKIIFEEPTEGPSKEESPIEPLAISKRELATTDLQVIEAAKQFLARPDLLERVCDHIEKLGLVGERSLAAQLYLLGTSRLLSRPLAAIILGSTSSGKSYAANTLGSLFPDEAILKAHRLSPQALIYMEPGSLVHRFIVMGERSRDTSDEVAEQTRSWRELVSDGECRLAVTVKDDGRLTTDYRVQKGPVAWIESTTLGVDSIFAEDKSRMLLLCADETAGQTERVLSRLAQDAQNPSDPDEAETIRVLHHTIQRLLEPGDVLIPYAERLAKVLPADRPEARRALGHLLSGIKAVALLHQCQRERTDGGLIVATAQDYEFVRRVFREPLGRSLGRILTAGAQTLLEGIKQNYSLDDAFCAADVSERTGIGRSCVYDRLKELRRTGEILLAEPGAGPVAAKYRLAPYPAASDFELPSLSPVETRTQTPEMICK
jgi:hypothetical protein